jgi:hypothetical protein
MNSQKYGLRYEAGSTGQTREREFTSADKRAAWIDLHEEEINVLAFADPDDPQPSEARERTARLRGQGSTQPTDAHQAGYTTAAALAAHLASDALGGHSWTLWTSDLDDLALLRIYHQVAHENAAAEHTQHNAACNAFAAGENVNPGELGTCPACTAETRVAARTAALTAHAAQSAGQPAPDPFAAYLMAKTGQPASVIAATLYDDPGERAAATLALDDPAWSLPLAGGPQHRGGCELDCHASECPNCAPAQGSE